MQTEFARDLQDQDQPIREAAKERPGKPIKMRLQPAIFRLGSEGKTGNYKSWRDVHWVLSLDSVSEVFAFRELLQVFFTLLNREGIAGVKARLVAERKEDAA